MSSYREWIGALRDLKLGRHSRTLVHVSLEAMAPVAGGADTVVGALLATCETVVAPTFTLRTLVVPTVGPPDNGVVYGVAPNTEAEIFDPAMPADADMGAFAEALRQHPESQRSSHPALSFAGVRAEAVLATQTLDEPLAPIRALAEEDADVLLVGTGHRQNVGLHWAERLAGRKQFIRWALTSGESSSARPSLGARTVSRRSVRSLSGDHTATTLGNDRLLAVPLRDMIHIAVAWMRQDPRALLCDRLGCERCAAVRAAVRVAS